MLFEVEIVPVGTDSRISNAIADSVSIFERAGLYYQLTASRTTIEGAWEEVIPVLKRVYEHAKHYAPHLITTIRVDDDPAATDRLPENADHERSSTPRSDSEESRSSEVDESSMDLFSAGDLFPSEIHGPGIPAGHCRRPERQVQIDQECREVDAMHI